MESMTGFGSAQLDDGPLRMMVTIRSVNHRFLDLVLRLPESLRPWEADLSAQLRGELGRGRIEVRAEVEQLHQAAPEIHLREDVWQAYQQVFEQMQSAGTGKVTWTAGDLARLPDLLEMRPAAVDPTLERRLLLGTAQAALDRLLEFRRREGQAIGKAVNDLLGKLGGRVAAIEAGREEAQRAVDQRLRQRLQELAGDVTIEADRLAQEVAILVDRADVQEEIDRLGSHLEAARSLLQGEAAGKKLDFLAQEIHRELNTIGSKCRSTALVHEVMEAKSHCEQIREQAQNLA